MVSVKCQLSIVKRKKTSNSTTTAKEKEENENETSMLYSKLNSGYPQYTLYHILLLEDNEGLLINL